MNARLFPGLERRALLAMPINELTCLYPIDYNRNSAKGSQEAGASERARSV
jgi:hypothetical protein